MTFAEPWVFRRTLLGGRHHLEAGLVAEAGVRIEGNASGPWTVVTPPGGEGFLSLEAFTDEPPLTPIATAELLESPTEDGRERKALAFLSYEEKLLAGSWRFLTYFGRDTLLSAKLLGPALKPRAVEAAIGSVLERLGPDGSVAHEEDIGDFAALRRAVSPDGASDLRAPWFDYKMVDDDFLLAPLAADFLLHTPAARGRERAFLSRVGSSGQRFREALRTNLELVLAKGRPFAARPCVENLISLKTGETVGQWRDSEEGLGGGRVPFDVNAVLVPAALEAACALFSSSCLGPDETRAREALHLANAWRRAASYFTVSFGEEDARRRVREYALDLGIDPGPALASLAGAVSFPSLALDGVGCAVPVMHSDEGLLLLYGQPDESTLRELLVRVFRPFPAGLLTPVGMVVSNAAWVEDRKLRASFSPARYHGAVIWSWQQAAMAAGLARQAGRPDLSPDTQVRVRAAQEALWAAIDSTPDLRSSELWSWSCEGGEWRAAPFNKESGHQTESNAVQLWSTVFLGVTRPFWFGARRSE